MYKNTNIQVNVKVSSKLLYVRHVIFYHLVPSMYFLKSILHISGRTVKS